MTAPLVPPDVDLRDFEFMPLDVNRLRDSKFTKTVKPEEFRAGVLLWCAAWHQTPGGSLPDDDTELASLAGYGYAVKEWRRVRPGALYGWARADDGRLYHVTLAQKANESWQSKLHHAHGKYCDRGRKENKARQEKGLPQLPIAAFEQWNSADRPPTFPPETSQIPSEKPTFQPEIERPSAGIPAEKVLKGEVRDREGRSKGREEVPTPSASEQPHNPELPSNGAAKHPRPVRRKVESEQGLTVLTWVAYSTAYLQRYGTEPVRNAKVNGQLAEFVKRIGASEAPAVAEFYVCHPRGLYVSARHATDLLLRDAEGLRTEWATQRPMTDTEARQSDRTAATGSVFGRLIDEERKRGEI